MYQILQKFDIHWHDGGPSIAMMCHLRRVSDLLYNWKSCLLCYMKDVVLHCSIFFKWNKLVRVRVRVRVPWQPVLDSWPEGTLCHKCRNHVPHWFATLGIQRTRLTKEASDVQHSRYWFHYNSLQHAEVKAGNTCRFTGALWGEFISLWWIPPTKGKLCGTWMIFLTCSVQFSFM